MANTINRTKFIEDYGIQIDPLFNRVDGLLEAITKSQELLAAYLVPLSDISADEVISDLLGILDHKDLIKFINDLTHSE